MDGAHVVVAEDLIEVVDQLDGVRREGRLLKSTSKSEGIERMIGYSCPMASGADDVTFLSCCRSMNKSPVTPCRLRDASVRLSMGAVESMSAITSTWLRCCGSIMMRTTLPTSTPR
jgi:hypothetical protein